MLKYNQIYSKVMISNAMILNDKSFISPFSFSGGQNVVFDGGQLSHKIERAILIISFKELSFQFVGVSKDVNEVVIFFCNFLLILQQVSSPF